MKKNSKQFLSSIPAIRFFVAVGKIKQNFFCSHRENCFSSRLVFETHITLQETDRISFVHTERTVSILNWLSKLI